MCSILFSTKEIADFEKANFFIQKRGPDFTTKQQHFGYQFVHNLLSITGAFTPQPLVEDGIAVLFNGEIYNFKDFGDYDNDTKCIIPLYKKYGKKFVSMLDGEFAIVIVDSNEKKILITTDIFGTKPVFMSDDGGICVGTYRSSVYYSGFKNVKKLKANTTVTYDFDGLKTSEAPVHVFDLKQHKNTFDDWHLAFAESIRKRAFTNVREKLFLGMSSGYDSGAIVCELMKQDIPFAAYSMVGSENVGVLQSRYNKFGGKFNLVVDTIDGAKREAAHKYLLDNTEDWKYVTYSQRSSYNEFDLSLWDDNGSNNLSHLCAIARTQGRKIFLSGGGADEIFSDYGYAGQSKYQHSNFGGKFPDDLSTIFPWASFFGSSMESYIMKDEVVGGSYGMETRYPFLDRKVVQEFLWLDVSLKNKYYKNVIHDYLQKNNFPFATGQKIGF